MSMMSSESGSKRRKLHPGEEAGGAVGAAGAGAVPEEAMTVDEMRAMMVHVKTEHRREVESMKERLSRVDELERKCQYLEEKCASLQRSVEILKKESSWEYRGPYIPLSHWIDQGFDKDYGWRVEDLVTQIEDMTTMLRDRNHFKDCYGKEHLQDIPPGAVNLGNGDLDYIVGHHDVLLPHWRELANAIQIYDSCNGAVVLTIMNVELQPVVLDMLALALKSKEIKTLELRDNGFDNEDSRVGIDFAVEVMKTSPSLKVFEWVENNMNSMNDMKHLLGAITSHPSLKHIALNGCCGGEVDGYEVLYSLLTSSSNFNHIDVGFINIETMGRTDLSDYLATNPALRELSLYNNRLDDNDATLIAAALGKNTNLRRLWLEENEFTHVGEIALCNAVFDCASLNSVSESNHTCFIEGVFGADANHHRLEDFENRAGKIYRLLSDRNRDGTNAAHLDSELGDGCLKLAPLVLSCVQRCASVVVGQQVGPLSIKYEILR